MNHRFGNLSFFQQSLREIVMSRCVFRTQIDGCLQLGNGVVQLSFVQENDAEVIQGDIVVAGHSKRMAKQTFAIAPMGRLEACAATQSTDYKNRSGAQSYSLRTP